MHELEFYETCRDNDVYPLYWKGEHGGCMPHFHSNIELFYVTDGEVKAFVNGRPFEVGKGRVLLLSSYDAHSYCRIPGARSLMLLVPLNFIPLYAPLLAKKAFFSSLSQNPRLNAEILHCLKKILSCGACCEQNENIVKSYIYVILGLVIKEIGLRDIEQDNFMFKNILVYLQSNYLSPVTLDLLAKRFGYSKYRFSHIFNESLGCNITQYVNSLRSRHAANLLRESDMPLLEVAMSSGFDSVRTFYRSFKNCYGVTPTQYRNTEVG